MRSFNSTPPNAGTSTFRRQRSGQREPDFNSTPPNAGTST